MASFWSSKKDNSYAGPAHNEEQRGRRRTSREYDQRDADERTRLLPAAPRPPRPDGYLDPDDPAVSPYNLWSVRLMRYFTILFLFLTSIWWVLLLVSIFVSPPGMHSRGSGFFDFSYSCLTIGNLLVTLLFFAAPSQAMRACTAVIAVILLVDMIIIASVKRIRQEEGWVGITSVIWAFLVAAWCVITDRVVAWGKREEEQRLTGRPETRRTIKEWVSVCIATVILVLYIVIAVLMTCTLSIRAQDASLEMPGQRYYVDGGKYEVHLACIGNRTDELGLRVPTVLLEAGEEPLEYEFEPWISSSLHNGTISRYCFWDRPGYAWSDNAPSPHSAGMSADALSQALAMAGEEGPWILVSAGYGSIVSRIFSARHPHDVIGLYLIDPLHEDLLYRTGSPSKGFVTWGWGIISPLGFERIAGALFKGRNRADRVYGRCARQNGKLIKAQLQESLVADSLSKNEAIAARTIQTTDVPLSIVSSGIEFRSDNEWERKQQDLTKLTKNLVGWEVVNKAPHRVWKTLEGRKVLEKNLGKLMKAARRYEVPPRKG